MKLSKHKISMMQQTISGNNRNWFAADYGRWESSVFEDLVENGYAKKRKTPPWMGNVVVYGLTKKGRDAVEKEMSDSDNTTATLTLIARGRTKLIAYDHAIDALMVLEDRDVWFSSHRNGDGLLDYHAEMVVEEMKEP